MSTTKKAPAVAAIAAKGPDTASPCSPAAGLDHDEGTIAFPQGLPGFPGATRFALRPLAGTPRELLVLQSADDPELRFLVLPYADRSLPLSPADVDGACEALGIRPRDAAVLLVVTTRQEPGTDGAAQQRLYVNLRAPVVLDTVRRMAVQHVLASAAYPVRHRLAAAA